MGHRFLSPWAMGSCRIVCCYFFFLLLFAFVCLFRVGVCSPLSIPGSYWLRWTKKTVTLSVRIVKRERNCLPFHPLATVFLSSFWRSYYYYCVYLPTQHMHVVALFLSQRFRCKGTCGGACLSLFPLARLLTQEIRKAHRSIAISKSAPPHRPFLI